MKSRFLLVLSVVAAMVMLCLPVQVLAGPVVKHEIAVSPYGDGDYPTVTAALDSITAASSTNRYRITVRPGTYNEPVSMKEYVDIVGSGQGNTTITTDSSAPAVTYANYATLENLTVTYNNTFTGGNIVYIPGTVSAVIKNVKVLMPDNFSGYGVEAASGANLQVLNSSFVLVNGTGSPAAIDFNGAAYSTSLLVSDCTIDINTSATNGPGGIYAYGWANMTTEIVNTRIKLVSAGPNYAVCVYNSKLVNCDVYQRSLSSYGAQAVFGQNIEIRDSKVTLLTDYPATSYAGAVADSGTLKIMNSVISSSDVGVSSEGAAVAVVINSSISGTNYGIKTETPGYTSFKIGNSQIIGGHNGVTGTDKVINCYDGNFAPIPNL